MSKQNSLKKNRDFSGLLALVPFLKPYRSEVYKALAALLVTALMVLFFGEAIKYLIDFGFAQKSESSLNLVLLVFASAVVVMSVAGYFRSKLINSIAEKLIADLRKKTFNHVTHLSAEFFEMMKAGDIVSRLTVDTVLLYNILSSSVSFFLRNLIFFVGGIGFLFFTSFKLSVISSLLILIAVSPIFVIGKKVKKLSHAVQSELALVGSRIEESVSGIKTIQAYLCEEKEARNFGKIVDSALKISLEKIRVKSFLIALVITLAFGGIALVLLVGGHDVLSGKITSGELSSFIFYSILSATSLVSLSQVSGQLQTAAAAVSRIFEILKIEPQVKEIKGAPYVDFAEKIAIKFRDVDFSYPSRKDFPLLKNFNLEILPYEKIAIVGASGAGKSTILQLLLRFYDIRAGEILLNGYDIKSISLANLRQNFSYISQDCFIFSGTIFENISYVDKDISEADVERLIAENPALNFINNLPQKMHTFVGEKGIKLSGGERQRIAIARAILKNSPILLLDEATSALDNRSEQDVVRAIAELSQQKTVITVAHRLSSIINADRIIFIKEGKIAEVGSHEQLLAYDGFYRQMYLSRDASQEVL
jgi:ATP-binding cassette subfamily B protein